MVKFIANVIDQMDLALDNLALEDVNYQRFSLMLVDNAIELTLHKFAEDKNNENKMWVLLKEAKHDPKIVTAALDQHFESKVKLAKVSGLISQTICDSIVILHSFRNQVYHQGLQHESILPAISLFYFRVSCDVLAAYQPNSWSWGSGQKIPYRAKKYLGNNPFQKARELCKSAFLRLKEVSEAIELSLVEDLCQHMEETIEYVDKMVEFLCSGDPKKKTRDEVIVDCQSWPFAFTDEGKEFARNNGSPAKTVAEHVEWIAKTYPWAHKKDPIPSWRKRLLSLQKETDEHKALKKYKDFMDQTETIREQIDEAALQLDRHIEEQIDMARGN